MALANPLLLNFGRRDPHVTDDFLAIPGHLLQQADSLLRVLVDVEESLRKSGET